MSTPEQRELAGRQIVARILADEIRNLTAGTRSQLEPTLDTEEAVAGELPDGTRLGKVARSKPAETARVTDEYALLAWVKEHRPEEIVESVNPSYLDKLKDQAKAYGHAFDPDTGEVIPGVEPTTGPASYRVTPSKEARALVLARLSELVGQGHVFALPASEETS